VSPDRPNKKRIDPELSGSDILCNDGVNLGSMFLKIFSPKKLENEFFQKFGQKWYHNNGFQDKRHFWRKKWQKSPKLLVITLTPSCNPRCLKNWESARSYE
jgi:hypothetical protein